MKILYDHQIFSLQRHGGISRYYVELIKNLAAYEDIDTELALMCSKNNYLNSPGHNISFFKLSDDSKMVSLLTYGLNRYTSMLALKNREYDIFHPTYYDPYFLHKVANKPVVITVYDLIHEKFPHYFKNAARNFEMKRKVLARADKIIAISENTKRDLLNVYNIEENRVEVIYLSNSLKPKLLQQVSSKLPKRYILYVGNRGLYKNFDFFFMAMKELLTRDKELYLICFGGGPFNPQEKQAIAICEQSNKVLNLQGDDDLLTTLYKGAIGFVFPSLYEGFGIPTLEAMQCGCPVLLSNTSSMPEVGGEAVLYFDPYSIESIRDALLQIINSETIRNELICKGFSQSQKFSWDKTAKKTGELYRSIL